MHPVLTAFSLGNIFSIPAGHIWWHLHVESIYYCVLFSLSNKAIATDQSVVIKATEYLLPPIGGNENHEIPITIYWWSCDTVTVYILPLIGGTVIPQLSIATAC